MLGVARYFAVTGGNCWPLMKSRTSKVWITDNVLCSSATGDFGRQGIAGLENYLDDSLPMENRFSRNVFLVP